MTQGYKYKGRGGKMRKSALKPQQFRGNWNYRPAFEMDTFTPDFPGLCPRDIYGQRNLPATSMWPAKLNSTPKFLRQRTSFQNHKGRQQDTIHPHKWGRVNVTPAASYNNVGVSFPIRNRESPASWDSDYYILSRSACVPVRTRYNSSSLMR